MANTYFEFKQFTVRQEHNAMKVCTDACIFGAWLAPKIPDHASILDIGCGTGLLMLMVAQQAGGEIHGIEVDLDSFKECKDNLSRSPWHKRLTAFPGDVRQYRFSVQYDFIISNPPFFENDLHSSSQRKNTAKHSDHLNFEALLKVVVDNLAPGGHFALLLPFHREAEFESVAAAQGLFVFEKLRVRSAAPLPFFRSILHLARREELFVPVAELVVKDNDGQYTPEFKELLAPYYLYL